MRRLLTAVSIMLLDSAYAAEGEVWFGSYWWVPLVAIALVVGAYQYRKLKAESRALKAAREDIINRMPRRDRETKELEARNLTRKVWLIVCSQGLGGFFFYLGLTSLFMPEMEGCLGRIWELEALGCPVWFSAPSVWVWIALPPLATAWPTLYVVTKVSPRLKQLNRELGRIKSVD